VDFPAPFGPTTPNIRPPAMLKLKGCNTGKSDLVGAQLTPFTVSAADLVVRSTGWLRTESRIIVFGGPG
jgi:hypothetical protein